MYIICYSIFGTTIDLLAPSRRRILSQNEHDDTIPLLRHPEDDPTIELPKLSDTAELPRVKVRPTARELMRDVFSSRAVQWPLVGGGFVVIAAVGLLIGGYLAAMEAGVVPNPMPGIAKDDPKPETSKVSDDGRRHTSPPPFSPSDWTGAVKPTATRGKASPSTEASASVSPSSSQSASVSASAQPEASASTAQPTPAGPTTAPTTTPSTPSSAPTSSASSPETGPTGSGSSAPSSPSGGTGSASPETADPTVIP